jgi:predicted  nucleic acid-binding Zn-ribbon protein
MLFLFSCQNENSDIELKKLQSSNNSCINTLDKTQKEIDNLKNEIKDLNINISELNFIINGLEKELYRNSEEELKK